MVPYWNTKCQEATNNKRKARDKMKRSRDLMDCIRYREAKAVAQRTLREEQRECWRNYCTTLNEQSKTSEVWRISKKMIGRQTNRGIPMIVENNTKHVNNKDKANAIARCLENNSSHTNFTPEFQQIRVKAEEERAQKEQEMEELNPELNEEFIYHELDACLRHCKKNKSPGEDKIQHEMLQHMPKCSKKILLLIINKIWQAGQLPKEWKHAIVLPFLKENKDPTDPNSYRPIALTTTICKVMERMVTNRINWHLEKNELFNKDQAGFRQKRCTIDQVMRLQNDVINGLNTKKYTIAIFLDLKKHSIWSGRPESWRKCKRLA